jgi:hypothetical protein
MPLVAATLQSGLQSAFASPAPDYAGCAQAWANAVGSYAAAIAPPSATVAAAQSALSGALASAFAAPNAVPGMESAFASFAATIGAGMAGAGFSAIPPPAPVGFGPQFAGPKPATHADAAGQIAALVDAWMHTGIAVLIAPPNTPQPWA